MTARTVASRKDKGRRFQHEIANQIIKTFQFPETDVIGRSIGAPGTDIILSDKAISKFPFAIECKRTDSKKKVKSWWIQASSNSNSETEPLLVFRGNREPALAITTLNFFKNSNTFDNLSILNKTSYSKWSLISWLTLASQTGHKNPAVLMNYNSNYLVLLHFDDLLNVCTNINQQL
jgi:hypothetical protein